MNRPDREAETPEQRLARVQREAPAQFIAYCVARGLGVDSVMADGTLHRCDVEGKQRGNKAGAYLLHLDGWPAGGCQNFTDGEGWQNWHATDAKGGPPSHAQSEAMRQQVQAAQAERERVRKIEKANAARRGSSKIRAKLPVSSLNYLINIMILRMQKTS